MSLGGLARAVMAHPRRVALGAVCLAVVAMLIGLPVRLDPSIVALLPPDNPHAQALKRVASETGGINTIMLTFDGGDPDTRGDTLDALALELAALDRVQVALHRAPPEVRADLALLDLAPAEIEALAEAVEQAEPENIAAGAAAIRAASERHLVAPSARYARVVVKPTESNIDPEFCSAVVADVLATVDRAELDEHGISLVYAAGPYVYIADGSEGIREDLLHTAGVTVLLVLGVLVLGFRSLRAPLLVFAPLLLATVLNLAFLRLMYGTLDTFTSFGVALLIGLGMDFAVHLVARVREERAEGRSLEDAVAVAWDETGPACLVAAATSAAGFASLAAGQFQGLAHLGIALSVGLMLCLACMLVLLPVLLPHLDREAPLLLGARVERVDADAALPQPRLLLAVLLAATAAAGAFVLPNLSFEYDITRLNRDKMAYTDMAGDVKSLVREAYPPVVIPTEDLADTRAEHQRLAALVTDGALPHVREVMSVETLIPSDQQARMPAMTRLRHALDATALPEAVRADLDLLDGWTPRTLTLADLPAGMVELVGGETRVLLLPQGELFDMRESAAFIDEIGAVADGAGSEQLAQGAVFLSMTGDMPRIMSLALLLVIAMTAVDLRRPAWVLATVGCLLLGLVWAGSAIAAVGQRVTLMNLIGFPILLGIGIDVVIHLAHRLRREGTARRALRTVGVASLLSTLTTVASFLSLTVASSGAIRSLGRLVVVGLLVVTVASGSLLLVGWEARVARKPEGAASLEGTKA